MKHLVITLVSLISMFNLNAQEITTNRNPVGMEHNVLFNNTDVTQTGSAALNLEMLFDGKFQPSYTSVAPSLGDPTIIHIQNLPNVHTQAGAYVGWSTRYWPSNRFKIEGYNSWSYPANGTTVGWKTLADFENVDYTGSDFSVIVQGFSITELRFTFYSATGAGGKMGVSELFFIHPEAVSPYETLIENSISNSSPIWQESGNKIFYNQGNVGIGTTNPTSKLGIFYTSPATDVSRHGLSVNRITSMTSSSTSHDKGIYGGITSYSIPEGIRDAGYKIGMDGSGYANSSNFAGTLARNYGVWARGGIYGSASTAVVENAYGLYADLLGFEGSIINGYGIFIASPGNGSNINNQYDLYASSPEAKNYFAGKVGIGTTAPGSFALNVNNGPGRFYNANATGNSITYNTSLSISSPKGTIPVYIGSGASGGENVQQYLPDEFSGNVRFNGAGVGWGDFGYYPTGGDDGEYGQFRFSRAGANVVTTPNAKVGMGGLYVKDKVGIGVTDPDEALTVNGIVHSKEVRVDLDGALAPDYVFEPDYDLLSLSEIKSFLEKENHLPGVPSAADMEENGINLKEMNLLLLKKVEELTLHLIEMKNEIDELKDQKRKN